MPTSSTDKQLSQRLLPATTDSVLYTSPSSTSRTYVKSILVCNTTGASKTYSIWVNQGGTASGDQFALVKDRTLAANATDQFIYDLSGPIIRGSSASIIAKASVANAVTITIYGTEVEET